MGARFGLGLAGGFLCLLSLAGARFGFGSGSRPLVFFGWSLKPSKHRRGFLPPVVALRVGCDWDEAKGGFPTRCSEL